MKIDESTTLVDLAFIVCTALHSQGDTAVLTGGGAATFYAPEAYQSRDLDFVFLSWSALGSVSEKALLDLGFQRRGDTYDHPATKFTLDFPVGPLQIGREVITVWDQLNRDDQILNILTPTDSVRDRLASYFYFNDFSALEQARAISKRHVIDLALIERWAQIEGEEPKFRNFRSRV